MRKFIAPILAIFISLVSVFFSPSAVYAEPAFDYGIDYSRLVSYAVPTVEYTVKSGDTLTWIAEQFGANLDALEKANSQIKDDNKIYPNEIVYIPCSIIKKASVLESYPQCFSPLPPL